MLQYLYGPMYNPPKKKNDWKCNKHVLFIMLGILCEREHIAIINKHIARVPQICLQTMLTVEVGKASDLFYC